VVSTSLLLADLALIVTVARVAGGLARRIGQPPVIGEILAGVLLGPTLLSGAITRTMFAGDLRSVLSAVASVGLVLFMLSVGHELDFRLLRGRARAVTGIALGSVALPFGLGCLVAIWLAGYRHLHQPVVFTLFVGVSLSITALPVLARIVTDRRLGGTRLGGLAVASAGAVDAAAWSLLAVVVCVAGGGSAWQLALLVPYLLVLVFVVRPLLAADGPRTGWLLRSGPVPLVAGLFLSAAATEWLGLHYVFGALLFGALLPRGRERLDRQIEALQPVSALLLPVFFVVAALNVDLSGLGRRGLGELAVIVAAAMLGKIIGAYLGARLYGVPGPEAAPVAVLMNARGVTELIVLQLGLQLGLLDTGLYSLMVAMALLTTTITGPLLDLVRWWQHRQSRLVLAVAPPDTGFADLASEKAA
jgi:Kef-type K+ transport system membrane component KefB